MGFHEIEMAGKRMFEQFPLIKRSAKRVYQLASVALSNERFKSEGEVIKVSPDDGYEYFYGYYDKSPWDADDRYMIAVKVKQAYKSVAPKQPGTVCLIDTQNDNKVIELGTTNSWNVQQSCMAQWMGPDFKTRIIYNDFRNGKYCSVIYNVEKMEEERELPLPVYDVARDGSYALSLDFSRLHRMRPGYGYSNLPDATKNIPCPDSCCIWKMDIPDGKVTELFRYTDFAAFEPDPTMKGASHKVNHLMISPDGKRFMVLHRWFLKGRKHTRLVTVNIDKTEMYNLSDDVFVSHCYWKNNEEILSFLRKEKTGNHYYLMRDKTQEYELLWGELKTDGHCSYSPDGRLIVTDTYPNRKRIAGVYICTEEDNTSRRIARVYSPFRYDNDCRCDLHPRWSRKGDKLCIDSVHSGKRALYVIPVPEIKIKTVKPANPEFDDILVSCVIPTYKRSEMLLRAVESCLAQTHKNVEVLVVDDNIPGDEFSINTRERIASINDPRVRLVTQKNHINGAAARNAGIRAARGQYVAFLDDDDEWLPDKIDAQLEYLKANPDCKGCSCLMTFYKNGVPIKKGPPYDNEDLLFKILSRAVQMFTSTCIFERETLMETAMFDEELVRHQDLQMLSDFAAQSKIAVLNEYYVKIHKDSEMNRPNLKKTIEVKKLYLQKMEKHINTFSKRDRSRIYGAHKFEVLVQALREHKFGTAIKYFFKIGVNPAAYKDVYGRYTRKKANKM